MQDSTLSLSALGYQPPAIGAMILAPIISNISNAVSLACIRSIKHMAARCATAMARENIIVISFNKTFRDHSGELCTAIIKHIRGKASFKSADMTFADARTTRKITIGGKQYKLRQFESYLAPTHPVTIGGLTFTITHTQVENAKPPVDFNVAGEVVDTRMINTTITVSSTLSMYEMRAKLQDIYDTYTLGTQWADKPTPMYVTNVGGRPEYFTCPIKFGHVRSKYHTHRAELLKLLDNYSNQSERLVILLSGPPGSGKSTMVKIIAKHMNYHIIDVNLNLLDDASFHKMIHANVYDRITVKPTKRVIVFEDIDAMTDVCNTRKATDESWHADTEDDEPEPNEPLDAEPEDDGPALDIISSVVKDENTGLDIVQHEIVGTARKVHPRGARPVKKKKEKLTLSRILNSFDGLLELPRCIIVITTNHVERLDPALVRPGRITRHFKLGRLTAAQADELVRDYYDEELNISGINLGLKDDEFSLAELGNLCKSSFGSFDEFLRLLQLERK